MFVGFVGRSLEPVNDESRGGKALYQTVKGFGRMLLRTIEYEVGSG